MDQQRQIDQRETEEGNTPDETRATRAADVTGKIATEIRPSSGGIELALAAGLAVGAGYWLDGVFGIRPILTIVLFFWAVLSLGIILYYRYRADMERLEANQVWNLAAGANGADPAEGVAQ